MDTLGLAATLVSLAIFLLALYEAVSIGHLIGKIPRFWYFLLAAITFLIVRRILVLAATAFSVAVPGYWATLDSDGTPIIFSVLLLLWIYDMKKSFQKAAPPSRPELPASEKT
jgi:hypothetical protein